jgi:PilZ domain
MRIRNRRQADRYPTGWIARYRTEEDDGWHECKALDVSETGAALEIRGPVTLGEELVVELRVGDDTPGGVLLIATVRNLSSEPDGTVRVGVEFASCTPLERSILALLLERESGVASR